VFDPGLGGIPKGICPGRLFLQSLWVQFSRVRGDPFDKELPLRITQKQTARENPRRIGQTYSWRGRQVKVNEAGNRPNMSDMGRTANCE
jgi:hypothetical protein